MVDGSAGKPVFRSALVYRSTRCICTPSYGHTTKAFSPNSFPSVSIHSFRNVRTPSGRQQVRFLPAPKSIQVESCSLPGVPHQLHPHCCRLRCRWATGALLVLCCADPPGRYHALTCNLSHEPVAYGRSRRPTGRARTLLFIFTCRPIHPLGLLFNASNEHSLCCPPGSHSIAL